MEDSLEEKMVEVFSKVKGVILGSTEDPDPVRAVQGFSWRRIPTVVGPAGPDVILIHGIPQVERALADNGITLPEVNYPQSLEGFYGRFVKEGVIREFLDLEGRFFLKNPRKNSQFDCHVFQGPLRQIIEDGIWGYETQFWEEDLDTQMLCFSEAVEFVSEWRAFVAYNQLLDIRPYAGDPFIVPDKKTVLGAIEAYYDAPAGCCVDFGVLKDGRTVVVEVNDGRSLGSYGLDPELYAYLLAARWLEIWEKAVPEKLQD